MLRPSMRGVMSILACSAISSATSSSIRRPSSGCCSSLPRNMIVTFTLLPSERNFSTWRVLVSKSPLLIFGRYLISLMTVCELLRRDSFARCASRYLNFPKSMMRHTGGAALPATSTRSRPCSSAMASASSSDLIPICAPSGPTRRTCSESICSLTRWSVCVAIAGTR